MASLTVYILARPAALRDLLGVFDRLVRLGDFLDDFLGDFLDDFLELDRDRDFDCFIAFLRHFAVADTVGSVHPITIESLLLALGTTRASSDLSFLITGLFFRLAGRERRRLLLLLARLGDFLGDFLDDLLPLRFVDLDFLGDFLALFRDRDWLHHESLLYFLEQLGLVDLPHGTHLAVETPRMVEGLRTQ